MDLLTGYYWQSEGRADFSSILLVVADAVSVNCLGAVQ